MQNNRTKHIAVEVRPEDTDFSHYFDDDGYKYGHGNKLEYVIFAPGTRNMRGFNSDILQEIENDIYDIFSDYGDGMSMKDAVLANGIVGADESAIVKNTHMLSGLMRLADNQPRDDMELTAKFLSIITGKEWSVKSCTGYSQGDYIELMYCKDAHTPDYIDQFGRFALGCGYEFIIDECRGYFVEDTVRWEEGGELRTVLAEACGCAPDELEIYLYDGEVRTPKYKKLDAKL